jgi:Bifunctional DNA primase/polymerase, N-terminal
MIDAALKLASQGFAVFPCRPGTKVPATPNGFKDATTNPAKVRRFFDNAQEYNIAIATGLVSGLLVFDDDNGEEYARLVAPYDATPTRMSETSRGVHYWYRISDPVPTKNGKANKLGDFDIKADGGYVMAPPSHHDKTPHIYRWLNDLPLAVAPDCILALVRKRPEPKAAHAPYLPSGISHNRPVTPGRYSQAALDREIKAVTNAPPGYRNHALNSASFSLHQLIASGELDEGEIQAALIAAAKANGLWAEDGSQSVMATIRSGARAGRKHPRTRNGRGR